MPAPKRQLLVALSCGMVVKICNGVNAGSTFYMIVSYWGAVCGIFPAPEAHCMWRVAAAWLADAPGA